MSLFAGIDVGTQSVKLIAYDAEQRRVVQSVSVALQLLSRDDGSREQLAQWWIGAVRECFLALPADLRSRLTGIGVSGQQHGFVPLDARGRVLTAVKLWCDTSTVEECAQIMNDAGGAARCVALAGNPILPGYTASKVRWLKQSRPDLYADLATILLPHDYVNFYLTGERFTEYGDASGTGWLDVRSRTWSAQMLRAIDPERDLSICLPPLMEHTSAIPLARHVAAELGLNQGVIVSVGGGDNMMAAIGTRNVRPGCLTVSLGTSGTLFAFADRPVVRPQGDIAAFCSSSGGWLPLICTMNCTVATEQVRALANIDLATAEQLLAKTSAGAGGVVTLPFYNGERTPNLPRAKASILGLDSGNATVANLLRSAMEGATFALRHGLQLLADTGLSFTNVVLTGGGAASGVWSQMVADIFKLPVRVLQQHEGAAVGAALQAAWVHQNDRGHRQAFEDLVEEHVAIDYAAGRWPDAQESRAYDAAYQNYSAHLAALQSLHSLQEPTQ